MSKENKLVPIPVPKVLYENRYCNQEGFSILVCGGKDKNGKVTNEVLELEIPSFNEKIFSSIVEPLCYSDLVNIKSDIIAFNNRLELDKSSDDSIVPVEIYSDKTKTWTNQFINTEEKYCYNVSSYMGKLYLIGGYINNSDKSLSSCYTYKINSNKWNKIASLKVARNWAACTIFEGKIVVTGGMNNWNKLKSIEAYDYHENKWTYLPDMIEERYLHAVVSMGNKMFIIGGYYITSCEVFDSYTRKYTNIYSKIKVSDIKEWCFYAYSFGKNIVVFQEFQIPFKATVVYLYDIEKEKWKNVQCDFTKNMFKSSFVKYCT